MTTLWQPVLAAVLAWAPLAGWSQERPRALENAQRQRELLQAGTVEFYHKFTRDALPPMLYTARFGGEDDAVALRGDEGGVFYCSDGTVAQSRRGPHVALIRKEDTWAYDSDGLMAMASLDPAHAEHVWKLRSLGLNSFNSYRDVHDTLWRDGGKQPDARSYSETVENGLHVVRAQTEHGVTTWYIDAQRGWNPVRVTYERDGQLAAESRSTLKEYDGIWFPATVAFFGGNDPDHPLEVVTVASAAFNRPDQPRALTPADIGIEAGMSLHVERPGGKSEFMMFDGEKAVSQEEFVERVRAGEIKYGPTFLRTIAEIEAAAARSEVEGATEVGAVTGDPTSARRRRESEWEAYTRKFIAKYHLDDGQSQKALSILRECQEEANQYLLRHKTEFERLQQKFQKVAKADAPKEEDLRARSQQAAKLRAPLNEIFEKQLKPRLEKLPTRAQREGAKPDQPAASWPSQTP
jgi:hypothetical protein